MPDRDIDIPFPIGGLEKRAGYQSGSPQFTPECLNIVPEDAEEGRSRGGSRPGTKKRYIENIGNQPRLIEVIESAELQTGVIVRYLIVGSVNGLFIGTASRYAWAVDTLTGQSPYTNPNDRYDVTNDGVVDSTDAQAILDYLAQKGSTNVDLAAAGHTAPPYYDVTGDGKASAGDALLILNRISNATSGSVAAEATGPVEIEYVESLLSIVGVLTTEADASILTEDNQELEFGNFNVDFVRRGSAAGMGGLLLIADAGTYSLSGTGSISGNILVHAPTDWPAAGVLKDDHVVILTPTSGSNVQAGTYRIADATGTNLTLDATVSNGNCTYQIVKGPKVLDPVTQAANLIVETAGTVPGGSTVVAVYRDRAVWAKDRAWYMSRQGDHTDYNYGAGAEDVQRAVAGAVAEAGQPGNSIIALAPGGDDYLVLFSDESTWVLRGDPAYGGQIDAVSRTVGAIGPHSWTHGPSGEIYFLSKSGLFALPPGAGGVPQPVSEQKLPRDLKDADYDNSEVSVVYDSIQGGIYIFVTPRSQLVGKHYWYDFSTQSFWPLSFSNLSQQPFGAVAYSSNPTEERAVTLLAQDGFIREFVTNDSVKDDDGTSVDSHLVLGPFNTAGASNLEGLISEIHGIIDLDASASVTMQIYTGDTAEAARDAATLATSPRYSTVFTAGRTRPKHPRVRANSFCVRLSCTGQWAYEGLMARMSSAGKVRT